MLKRFFLASVFLFLLQPVSAAELPFYIGEELVYSITWNGIPVAWTRAVTEIDRVDNREVLALRLYTKTYPFFDPICKVDDFHESLIDPQTLLPIRYTQNIRERSYRCHEVTVFDFNTLKAHYRHLLNGKEKTYDIKPGMRDMFSFMYFMRSVILEENTNTQYQVMADEKVYDLFIKTFEVELVNLPHYDRKIPSLSLKPEAMFDGLYVRKGKATVWVSRDPRRLLTQAKLSTPFGRVTVTLQKVNGPGDDFWITDKKDGDETDD